MNPESWTQVTFGVYPFPEHQKKQGMQKGLSISAKDSRNPKEL